MRQQSLLPGGSKAVSRGQRCIRQQLLFACCWHVAVGPGGEGTRQQLPAGKRGCLALLRCNSCCCHPRCCVNSSIPSAAVTAVRFVGPVRYISHSRGIILVPGSTSCNQTSITADPTAAMLLLLLPAAVRVLLTGSSCCCHRCGCPVTIPAAAAVLALLAGQPMLLVVYRHALAHLLCNMLLLLLL